MTDFVRAAVASPASPGTRRSRRDAAAARRSPGSQELDKLANARKWGQINFVHPDYEFINDCAYFDYQRQRVFVRTSKDSARRRAKQRAAPQPKAPRQPAGH